MKPDPRVLIIDEEKAARRLLRAVLAPQGYRVFEATNGKSGLKRAVECEPDVIVLETLLPDGGGLAVLRDLREWNWTPVLVLSSESDGEAKAAALDSGASDYMTKPFSSAELLARLRVLQRALPNMPEGPLLIEENLVANLATHEVKLKGRVIELTPKEKALFFVLAQHAGKVVTHAHLLRSIWGMHSAERTRDLRVLVRHLRQKLEPHGAEVSVRTAGGVGYKMLLRPGRECRILNTGS